MIIRVASCEDNASIRTTLASFFDQISKEENEKIIVDFYSNGEQLLANRNINYDIYILDIHMGDQNLNGLQIANTIRERDPHTLILFLTCLTRYLKEGYKVKAYRYLTKPISYNEFKSEICDAIKNIRKNENNYLNLADHNSYNKILFDDIYYIETNGRKTLIHTHNGDIICSYPISQLEELLKNKNFFRCHNSYIVNMLHVEHLDRVNVKVHGQTLPISRSKIKPLKEAFAEFLSLFI